ncbi:LpqN/LpqT family lipoprotein [Mycobacterium sp. smrl_JER01]|uniref:LpqN/LpqT family lipoprotein n=1 Tax=Mycobacterium sp. smrl_JER01 TaxID=3402633 RepID=UPI003AC1448D
MQLTAVTHAVAIAAAVAVIATGCTQSTSGSGETASAESVTASAEATTSAQAGAPETSRVAPRQAAPEGPARTIADYIAENGIQETQVKRGDPGAPIIDLPTPEGWQDAGADTPEWAYGAIIYTGPEAAEYSPSVVALVSKLVGDVDPQAVLDAAAGEATNLPGWTPMSDGKVTTLGDFPAYQLGGTWVQDGVTKVAAQKTVVIPGSDGSWYVLQLNADGLEEQIDILGPATIAIDDETVITPQ